MKSTFRSYSAVPAAPAARDTFITDRLSGMCFLASLLDQISKESAVKNAGDTGNAAHRGQVMVMLADDDCDDRELFTEVVSEFNTAIQVKSVEDGRELMSTLNESEDPLPAIIFLDLNMPGKNGKECLKEIRNNSRLKDIPVAIYSTSVNQRDIHETHSIGANLYIPKPNSFKGLTAMVAKVFSLDLEKLKLTPPMNQFLLSADAN